ncbi:MAG: DUF3077 domain-containing protein [Accumulibacter sp.]|jgi:hypothetical protein|uniref:DUF3077 domain-containing protein n=1 Tax=Accumulibacter sp. TaxID=2053492 RepID=UPI002FC3BAFD
MAEDTSPLAFFAPHGQETLVFNVREGLPDYDALQMASSFLSSVITLASHVSDDEDNSVALAAMHLAEMAKALVDTVVESLIEARKGADQTESGVRHG